jgi:hypothetical protein
MLSSWFGTLAHTACPLLPHYLAKSLLDHILDLPIDQNYVLIVQDWGREGLNGCGPSLFLSHPQILDPTLIGPVQSMPCMHCSTDACCSITDSHTQIEAICRMTRCYQAASEVLTQCGRPDYLYAGIGLPPLPPPFFLPSLPLAILPYSRSLLLLSPSPHPHSFSPPSLSQPLPP